jgi:general stress protein 26
MRQDGTHNVRSEDVSNASPRASSAPIEPHSSRAAASWHEHCPFSLAIPSTLPGGFMLSTDTVQTATPDPVRRKISDIAREFDSAMLVTHTPRGGLHARPMSIVRVEPEASLWFATRLQSPKVDEVNADHQVLVVMQSTNRNLSITGQARIVRDPNLAHELWNEGLRLWFRGPDDPELALLLVEPQEAEYWVMSGTSWVKLALEAFKAYVRDEPLRGPELPGQHEKLVL